MSSLRELTHPPCIFKMVYSMFRFGRVHCVFRDERVNKGMYERMNDYNIDQTHLRQYSQLNQVLKEYWMSIQFPMLSYKNLSCNIRISLSTLHNRLIAEEKFTPVSQSCHAVIAEGSHLSINVQSLYYNPSSNTFPSIIRV